jgi:hypothetical protein
MCVQSLALETLHVLSIPCETALRGYAIGMQTGDMVRVSIDTHGGFHPFVGARGYYMDVVRALEGDQVILTRVSWAPRGGCTPTSSPDASVEVKGKVYTIRMLDRGSVWWAKLPGALEPLATGATYEEALSRVVRSLS